ncbi:hypothetical protein [Peribacillus kribbensis]|uniref:hypothetical protein n=1 Tax=Peribacillus kribbensis TaxID=356658 RepID=UPI0004056325|nr:hypothetical protein [Peribacillus kribbensis]
MKELYFSQDVKYLLLNSSSEKVDVIYDKNPQPFRLPLIGTRPPFYSNPRYQAYYPPI